MPKVTATQVDEAHTEFCTHMGLEPDTWHSILEYIFYTSFEIVNVARKEVRTGTEMEVADRVALAIKMLKGPHAATIVAAYKIRRYSLIGKVRFAALSPAYVLGFIGTAMFALVQDFWHGFNG